MLAKINWKPTNTDLRKFGITLIIGFAVIGSLFWWKKGINVGYWIWGISFPIGALAILIPPASKPFYMAWMSVAFVMGTLVSFVVMFLIFYMIVTPVGILMRLFGRDSLRLKKSSFDGKTYWHDHPDINDKERYKRLF